MEQSVKSLFTVPRVIGHRGVRGYAPENTLSGLYKASAMGLSWVECDVRLCACGTVVVIHDEDMSRTAIKQGCVREMSYAQIEQFDVGTSFSPEFAGEKVPRLEDFIQTCSKLNLGANIELKACPNQEQALVESTLSVIRRVWPKHLPAPLLSSFCRRSLQLLREKDAEVHIGLLVPQWEEDGLAYCDQIKAVALHMNAKAVNQERIQSIHKTGRLALSYTVNSKALYAQFRAWGLDAVFTDYPDRLGGHS